MPAADLPPFEVAIVGAGPRGVCVLERLCANAPEFLAGRGLLIHVIDPFPAGSGRVWRYDQSPLLQMNSTPDKVGMFTDETVEIAGPICPGFGLVEWIAQVRSGELNISLPQDVRDELVRSTPESFVSRRLLGAHLEWVFRQVVADRPQGTEIREHRTLALRLTEEEKQLVWLADRPEFLSVDAVVLTVGHLDANPVPEIEVAPHSHLRYYPPAYTADVDYSDTPAGETVLVRGLGLAATDLLLLLTEGRGGKFVAKSDRSLSYLPSGAEPKFVLGSRRGTPYHAKIGYSLQGKPLQFPRFFDKKLIDELAERQASLDLFGDIWPHIAKEIAWGYYGELFTGHPDRVRLGFDEFAYSFADSPWDSEEMQELITRAVPAGKDRLALAQWNRPLAELRFASSEKLNDYLRKYLEADLERRSNIEFSPDLGAIVAMQSVAAQLPVLIATGKLKPQCQMSIVDRWWHNFFSFITSGPPPRRLAELLALQEQGIITFLGSGMRVWVDKTQDVFVATGENFPGSTVATTLIEARLPDPSVDFASDALVRSLGRAGDIVEEAGVDSNSQRWSSGRIRTQSAHVVNSQGKTHPRRFSLGPQTSARIPSSFAKPGTNAVGFRENDAVAREILQLASAPL